MEIIGLTLDWVKANPISAFERILELEEELEDMDESKSKMETGTAYFIEASTGCSCCSYENRTMGPYRELDFARSMAKSMYDRKYLASQYAPNGRYALYSAEYEQLPDGRLILGGTLISDGFCDEFSLGIDLHPDNITFERKHLETIGN